jgi:uncharacterized protein with HEPN domain
MKRGTKNPGIYLEDILSAIQKIERYVKKGQAAFLADGMMQDAVIRQISIIGEAAAKLPLSTRKKYADVPWKKVIGMRNVVIHDYSETDIPTVWKVVERDLPKLKETVKIMAKAISK